MESAGTARKAFTPTSSGFWRKPFLIVLAASILCGLDPLGIEEATAKRAEQTVMQLSSALYPRPDAGEKKVTVVLLDEAYAKRVGAWPPSYRQQGYLLGRIEHYRPAAIFIDLIYNRPHRGDDPKNLFSVIEPDLKTPLFFAALSGRAARCLEKGAPPPSGAVVEESSILPDIRKSALFDPQRVALVEWRGCGDLYPLALGNERQVMTPAMALYRQIACKTGHERACRPEEFKRPMKVRWGAFPPLEQAPLYPSNACQYDTPPVDYVGVPWRRLQVFVREFVLSAVGDRKPRERLPCPAVSVIRASALIETDAHDGKVDALFSSLFSASIVLLGAKIPGSGDVAVSPVHGQLTGAEFHAMALDNLLRLGTRYAKEVPEWFMLWLVNPLIILAVAYAVFRLPLNQWGRFFELTGLVFLAGVAAVALVESKPGLAALASIGAAVLFVIAPTAVGRAAVWFLLICLLAVLAIEAGYAPGNWLVAAIAAVLVGEKIHDERHGEHEEALVSRRIAFVRNGIARAARVRR